MYDEIMYIHDDECAWISDAKCYYHTIKTLTISIDIRIMYSIIQLSAITR